MIFKQQDQVIFGLYIYVRVINLDKIKLKLNTFDINPYPAMSNFQPLVFESRYRDSQTQVVENYSYLLNFGNQTVTNHYV